MVGLIRCDGAIGVNANGPGIKQFVQSGDLRILAIAGERDPDLPDVKMFREQGYPELDDLAIERWIGAGPGGDAEAVAILGEAIKKAATDPEFIEKAKQIGVLVGAPKSGDDISKKLDENLNFYSEFKDILSQKPQ